MTLYGYVDKERGLMIISDEINKQSLNTIIKLCSEDEVVKYSEAFIREVYQDYVKEQEETK